MYLTIYKYVLRLQMRVQNVKNSLLKKPQQKRYGRRYRLIGFLVGTRGIVPFCDMAERGLDPLLPGSGRVRFVWFEKSRTAGIIREQCLPCPLGHYTSEAPSERQRPRATFCTVTCKGVVMPQRGRTYARGVCFQTLLHV